MELRIIEDEKIWSGFLAATKLDASFFQTYAWGEFEGLLGNTVYRFGIYDGSRLIGLAQSVLVSAKRGRFLHIRNGPVFSFGDINKAKALLMLLVKEAKKLDCSFLRISPLLPATEENIGKLKELALQESQMHDVDAEITWVLDLTASEEELLMGMRKSTRYLIRQAQKIKELQIELSTDPGYLKHFCPVYEETVARQKWNAYSLDYLQKEFDTFQKRDMVRLFLARYKGKVIAASLFIYFKGEVYYHHSGSLSDFKKIPAMYLLHWESIKYARDHGYKTYNFFGIARDNDPHHPWAGLTLFKMGFGGRKREWLHAKDLPVSKSYWLTHYFEKLERKRRGYR